MIIQPEPLIEGIFDEKMLIDIICRRNVEKCTERFIATRFRGTQVRVMEGVYRIIAWERNVVMMHNNITYFPTIVDLTVQDGYVRNIRLDASFRGSQGPVCSYEFISSRLEHCFGNIKFEMSEAFKRKCREFPCIHINEVLLAACAFYKRLVDEKEGDSFESECLYPYLDGNSMVLLSIQSDNGRKRCSKLLVDNVIEGVTFNERLELIKLKNIKLCYMRYGLQGWTEIAQKSIIELSGMTMIQNGLLRFSNKCWQTESREIRDSNFYYTTLYPVAMVGLIIQFLALIKYKNNYAYFQQCISVIQRKEEVPLCIGVIKSIEERDFYFKEI